MVRRASTVWTAVQLRMVRDNPQVHTSRPNCYLTRSWLIGPSTEDPGAIVLLPTGCWRASLRERPVPRNAISPRKVVVDKMDVL
jgi:hypothetical protein